MQPLLRLLNCLLAIVYLAAYTNAAFPDAPNGYAPKGAKCPGIRPAVRDAGSLSSAETAWLSKRRNATVPYMSEFLERCNITGFDAQAYISQHKNDVSALPNIALAYSGGGLRAMLNGGGALKAFDLRETNSTLSGHLGGLLQSSTYIAGLSGGGWLVGSVYVNNLTKISDLQNGKISSTWNLKQSILEGPKTSGLQLFSSVNYYDDVYDAVHAKHKAGYETTLTDFWGRALSYQFINATKGDTKGGEAYTWSSIQRQNSFVDGSSPMPVLIADARAEGEKLIPGNTTIYEFNPFEFGSWDPAPYGFIPMEYLGSNFSAGVLPNNTLCVRGFDNAGFVMGTSSSLFNQIFRDTNSSSLPSIAKDFLNRVFKFLDKHEYDIAEYTPNPFYGYRNSTTRDAKSTQLTLIDGGEDGQNLPLHPLIQPNRHVDVIIAVDSSSDTPNHWPNGSALIHTYRRAVNTSINAISNGTTFPSIPDVNTFINFGLNTRPVFFGCNATNTTSPTPLIVYLPNTPYVYYSNISTFQSTMNSTERDNIITNGYNVATMGNATADRQWPACLACAILSRSFGRTATKVPATCQQCFTRYCWDGTLNQTVPVPFNPTLKLQARAKRS